MNIEVSGVTITLTKAQLAEIAKQTNKCSIENINSIKDAEKVLKDCKNHISYLESNFPRTKDWNRYQIETIAKAMSYIDNGNKEWIIKLNSSEYLYYPYFRRESSGLVFDGSCYDSYLFYGPVAFTKTKEASDLLGKKFIRLFENIG